MNTNYIKEEFLEGEKPHKMVKTEDEAFKGNKTTEALNPQLTNPYMQMGTMLWYGQMMRMPYGMYPAYVPRMRPNLPMPPVDPRYLNTYQQAQFHHLQSLQAQKAAFLAYNGIKKFQSGVNSDSSTPSVKTEDSYEGVPVSMKKMKKKTVRVSACKNYIGLLCAGFSRAVLTSEKSSPILQYAAELITERKSRFIGSETQTIEQLVESFRVYVHQNICGKKVKKSNRERDFKVRNSEELDQLLIAQQCDTELTCLRKEILREMMNFFFNSDCYVEWLSKGMISESNRVFFLRNKKEIQKKFQNPAYYKPRFNHGQDETASFN